MSSTVNFSVPATNGSAGHATTQTSFFLHVPAAPSSQTCLFDWNLNAGYYYRCTLGTDRHVRLVFSLSGYGSATVDLGAIPVSTWTWLSCGFSTAGGLYVRGDMTPFGAGTTTVSALASAGTATGTTLLDVAFGIGVALTSTDSNFPDNAAAGWLMSKLIITQISADSAGGNPYPPPTTDFAPGAASDEYLAHDPLGAITVLTDSGTNALDLPAGPQGLTIVEDGPALLPSSPGPGGAHEGDLSYYHLGEWITLHIGTAGQVLTATSGEPAWAAPSGSVTSVSFSAPATFTVAGSPITSSGTISLAWATQNANIVLAGPASGAAAAPTFRSLVAADLPVSTGTTRGAVKPGTGLSVAGDGTLSLLPGAALPSGSEGDVLIYSGGTWVGLAPGTTGQFLRMAGGYPTWGESEAPLTDTTGALVTDGAGNIIMA